MIYTWMGNQNNNILILDRRDDVSQTTVTTVVKVTTLYISEL